ncbi:porin family protein [Mucilaginibacter sp. CSA2-8R]|uniref:porin family protein n=1 Tax=Mucilaginibacter sp. CSA2-8R TaxID=3141542 RepID=UPI00315DFDB7
MLRLIVLCLFMAIFCATLRAQQKASFAVQAGVSRAIATQSNQGVTQFSGGLSAVFPFSKKLNFQTGLFYNGKGWANKGITHSSEIRINYLQVPLYINYLIKVKAGHLYIGAGPYMAVALSGWVKSSQQFNVGLHYAPSAPLNLKDGRSEYMSKLTIGKNEQYEDVANYSTKRMDYGLTGHAGFILNNGFFVNAGYDMGLANISYDNVARRLQTATVSLGYFF